MRTAGPVVLRGEVAGPAASSLKKERKIQPRNAPFSFRIRWISAVSAS